MAGIYVHIPFCRKACTYCDFHFSTNLNRKRDLVACIAQEAGLRKDFFGSDLLLDTLYFGGGTPSLLSESELASVLDGIHQNFSFKQGYEFTLECNPDDLSPEVLAMLKRQGVNRLSIGVQSFREQDLELMNRSHNAEQARNSILDAQAAGFENFTVDLIYGIPGLTDADWQANVAALVDLAVPHISAYALTVEERTALEKQVDRGEVILPQDQTYENQYLHLIAALEKAGFEHYELSNFAKPGWRSQHNSSYWFGDPYLGLGPAAHSHSPGSRSWNVSNNAKYIKLLNEGQSPIEETETLSDQDQLNEFLLTRFRLREGIHLVNFSTQFGWDLAERHSKAIKNYKSEGWMVEEDGWLRLSPQGLLLSNRLIGSFFAG